MFKTHLAFGFLVGLFSLQYLHPANQVLFFILVLIGACLPDIDHPKSKLGKYFKPIGWLFEHRGFFHSVFMLAILSLVVLYFFNWFYTSAIFVGFLSHLISDAITVQGIMPFHPLSRFRLRGPIETNSIFETIIFLALLAFDALKLIRL